MAKKNKTSKSLKKRFRITATGKIKHGHVNRRHLLAGRTSKRKRQLGQLAVRNDITAKKIILAMGGA